LFGPDPTHAGNTIGRRRKPGMTSEVRWLDRFRESTRRRCQITSHHLIQLRWWDSVALPIILDSLNNRVEFAEFFGGQFTAYHNLGVTGLEAKTTIYARLFLCIPDKNPGSEATISVNPRCFTSG
jgi:hypothetical protein